MKYSINNYHRNKIFSSFLPGISGPNGVPIWAFYVNRGQAIASFGIQNKDRSIMEFNSAQITYKIIEKEGFRTFIKHGEELFEPFTYDSKTSMTIGTNSLEIQSSDDNFEVKVRYAPMVNIKYPALVREVEIKAKKTFEDLEIFDGMSQLIPYGLNQDVLKNIPQTASAWNEVEKVLDVPLFRTRISIEDTAEVEYNHAAHYYLTIMDEKLQKIVVDPHLIFGVDRSFDKPYGIFEESSQERLNNYMPCAFSQIKTTLNQDDTIKFYSVIGFAENNEAIGNIVDFVKDPSFLSKQANYNKQLMTTLLDDVTTETNNNIFDNYIRQSYLDNFLRGGYPYIEEERKPLYLYGRKHGDLERDYNYFEIEDSFYSQGNGNYRDVNQNRRNDLFFKPKLKDINIRQFLSLIQLDGYNPLVIEPNRFVYQGGLELEKYLNEIPKDFLKESFTFAEISKDLDLKVPLDEFVEALLSHSTVLFDATFKEGYWVDHWTYNLDLIEDYLKMYPEELNEFISEKNYLWYHSPAYVKPRKERYSMVKGEIRQYSSLEYSDTTIDYITDENDELIESSLIEKIFHIHAIKIATLDPSGMGIEMEAGKPGWYDALNGLPGILGSSVMEFYELVRLNKIIRNLLNKTEIAYFELHKDLAIFIEEIAQLSGSDLEAKDYWDKANNIKESFRKENRTKIHSEIVEISKQELVDYLDLMFTRLSYGLDKLKDQDHSFSSYFYYDKNFNQFALPPFLEGAVNYMNIADNPKELFSEVKKKSGLYDEKLKMFKVNASLKNMPLDLGRCRAFTPGWLENESIWMHMEYKFLLTMLENKLYQEFFEVFEDVAIPFLNPEIYGRSLLENVSFIASSANPDPSIHGRGFVARLSGSTAEILSIWRIMFFGTELYSYDDELEFKLQPAIPSYLIGNKKTLLVNLHSNVQVIYHLNDCEDLIPGTYNIIQYKIHKDGEIIEVDQNTVKGALAKDIRNQDVAKIEVFFEKKTPLQK